MSRLLRPAGAALAFALAAAGLLSPTTRAQVPRGAAMVAADSAPELREWGQRLDSMRRSGEMRMRQRHDDVMIEGREHERLEQYHRGVRVFGGDIRLQLDRLRTVSMFGTIFDGIDLDTVPALDADEAAGVVRQAGAEPEAAREPELVILPREDGRFALAWRVRASIGGDVRQYFVDAGSGAMALEYSDVKTQLAVGRSTGVLGDEKKISVRGNAGQFVAEDVSRPAMIRTYDMQGNMQRVIDFINGRVSLNPSTELATDSDNNWTDGAVVDAHVYAGRVYDFFYKRFNRRGLNNADLRIVSLVHPARRSDIFGTAGQQHPEFFANAGYYGGGIMIYGVGLPPGVTSGGRTWDYASGALDIVAHELTHGVTDYTSDLIYRNESGALNEAFSDIMATAAEFFFHQAGSGNLRADYLCGEDVVKPSGIRSLADPRAFGHPDHYSSRFTGSSDNGGVHINSGIANHAFYLAIEGGTNRTSGLAVTGVGGANREQIERVFYRAFTELMPSSATFAVARAATIQAARDLYGTNSAAERAVTQAWTAVGVE